jgi:REP element-mobilizing transposase RayT
MTAPRQVLPGATYLVTRRCSERRFFLRPSQSVNDIFLYVLAIAAERYGVLVHVVCVLSNHYHLVVTDPGACLPEFQRYLDGLVARAINCSLGRWESFWAPSSYSAVALTSPDDVVAKAAYVLANPVAAALVERGRHWPGLWSAPRQIGSAPLVAKRPSAFFRDNGYMPESVELELAVPPGFASAAEFRERLEESLRAAEERARSEHERDGFRCMGAAKLLAQKPTARPATRERRRGLNPRVTAPDKWKRIEAIERLEDFVNAYREALAAWRDKAAKVLFPAGTYLMRVAHGVACAPV